LENQTGIMRKIIVRTVLLAFLMAIIWGDSWLRAKILIGARRFYFVSKSFLSAPAKNPESAYLNFRQALANTPTEAERYLSPEARDRYRFILSDSSKRAMILSWPERLNKLYQMPCDELDYCLMQAVYNLEYYQSSTTVRMSTSTIEIAGGIYNREIIFIQRPDGQWWIKKL